MAMSPWGLPNTGLSGSLSTESTLGSRCARAAPGMAASAAALPKRPSMSRRLAARLPKSIQLRIYRPAEVPPELRRESGDVTRQHIERHSDNDSGKHDIQRTAAFR